MCICRRWRGAVSLIQNDTTHTQALPFPSPRPTVTTSPAPPVYLCTWLRLHLVNLMHVTPHPRPPRPHTQTHGVVYPPAGAVGGHRHHLDAVQLEQLGGGGLGRTLAVGRLMAVREVGLAAWECQGALLSTPRPLPPLSPISRSVRCTVG